ncbi:MAG TPA: bifunctional metallophosphatase/5'-nucleotidase, partial [Methylomirabilota bacterium]|nr:bifunctional metallophosphatase/5'-nucleotidase [Methylomirabilota bacterium]
VVPASPAPPPAVFAVQILHSSDNESGFVDPITLDPKILHYAALVEGLRLLAPQGRSLHLTAGDHTLPGPFYQAAAQVPGLGARGLADITFFNAMGLVANGLGNHEFDGGINDFARMLAAARYPFISANLDFSGVRLAPGTPPIRVGRDGGSATENAGRVVRSAWVEVGGERIGLIGRAPADFFNVLLRPAETVPGLDFVGGRNPGNNQPLVPAAPQVLEQVRLLEAQGINKIILVDHAQDFTADPLSTQNLHGIDVIITAGSTGFIAGATPTGPFNRLRPGDRPLGEYPVRRTDRDGHPVLVVNSDQLYRYVGHLIVGFDGAGRVVWVDPRSGPVSTTPDSVTELGRLVGRPLSPPTDVTRVYGELTRTALISRLMTVVGQTRVELNGDRRDVRTRETNLGRLVVEALLWQARARRPDTDVALYNGGGYRGSIPGPRITGFTVASALAFDNPHVILEVTAAQLLAAMENAVSRVPAADGRFPQVAGLVVEFDAGRPGVSDQPSMATPSRVKTLRVERARGEVDPVVTDFRMAGDPGRRFVLATNDFLAGGGDGYQALKAAATAGTTPLDWRSQQTLIEYVRRVLGGTVALAEPVLPPRVVRLP